jgi:hypothetical protein
VRAFLVRVIVDVLIEIWRRKNEDPVFAKKLEENFAKLDTATTEEEGHAAAKEIQALIASD